MLLFILYFMGAKVVVVVDSQRKWIFKEDDESFGQLSFPGESLVSVWYIGWHRSNDIEKQRKSSALLI